MNSRLNVLIPDWLRAQAHAKAQADAADLSRIVRRMLWAWVRGEINAYKLPDPPNDRSN